MNREQRRKTGKLRRAALALVVAGVLAAGGAQELFAAEGELVGDLAIHGGGGGGGYFGCGSSYTEGGGGGGGYVEYSENDTVFAIRFGGGGDGYTYNTPVYVSAGSIGGGGVYSYSGGASGEYVGGANGGEGGKGNGRASPFNVPDAVNTDVNDFGVPRGVPPSNNGTFPDGISVSPTPGTSATGSGAGAGGDGVVYASGNVNLEKLTLISGENGSYYYIAYGGAGGKAIFDGSSCRLNVGRIELYQYYSGYGIDGIAGSVEFSVETLVAKKGYSMDISGWPEIDISNYEFDITGAENGDCLLAISSDTVYITYFNLMNSILTGTPAAGLSAGDQIILIDSMVSGEIPPLTPPTPPLLVAVGNVEFEIKTQNGALVAEVTSKSISVGSQTGSLTAGSAGSVTYTVATTGIADGSEIYLEKSNEIWGVSLDPGTSFTTGDSTEVTINITAETPPGSHQLGLYIDGLTSDKFTLEVGVAKSISVGSQTGTLTAGSAGAVTYTVTTTGIAAGTGFYLDNINGISGISLNAGTSVTTGDSTTVTINTTAATPPGSHPLQIMIIDVAVSNTFYLVVGTGGGGNTGGGGGEDTKPPENEIKDPTEEEDPIDIYNEPNEPNKSSDTILTPKDTQEENGVSITNVSDKEIVALIELAESHKDDVEDGENEAIINIRDIDPEGSEAYVVNMTGSHIQQISDSSIDLLAVNTFVGQFRVRVEALEGLNIRSGARVQIRLSKLDHTGRPGVNAQLMVATREISEVNGVYSLEIRIPYELQPGEDVSALFIEYIKDDGTVEIIRESRYDEEKQMLVFFLTHLSKYGIAYKPVLFSDVSPSHWGSGYITFLASRGVITNLPGTNFRPDDTITRAEFINLAARAFATANLGSRSRISYQDVDPGQWYALAVGWSYINNISRFMANGREINPDNPLNREEAATLANNVSLGLQLRLREVNPEVRYKDMEAISLISRSGVERMSACEIVFEGGGGSFFPKSGCTRAEAARIISLLLSKMR